MDSSADFRKYFENSTLGGSFTLESRLPRSGRDRQYRCGTGRSKECLRRCPNGENIDSMTRVALTIAGSDPSGGAGIQADLKTFHQFGVYGEAVITLLTVQNTQGVSRVECLDPRVGDSAD